MVSFRVDSPGGPGFCAGGAGFEPPGLGKGGGVLAAGGGERFAWGLSGGASAFAAIDARLTLTKHVSPKTSGVFTAAVVRHSAESSLDRQIGNG